MPFFLPDYVKDCLNRLERAGWEAWCVGGCVRDLLLSKEPHDFDVATDASPEEVEALFDRCLTLGSRFGTVTALMPEGQVEITTYRVEGSYQNHRKPKRLRFSSSLLEDVSRRDFTINAMAYHPKRGIQDFFDGQGDLERRIIRTVGDAQKRFEEDALRILRAFRFSCQLDFTMEPATLAAALERKNTLRLISRERVTNELCHALETDKPSRLTPLFGGADLSMLDSVKKHIPLRLATLCVLIGVLPGRLFSYLRLPARTQEDAVHFYEELQRPLPENRAAFKRRLASLPEEQWPAFLDAYAIVRGKDASGWKAAFADIQNKNEPWKLSQLAVNGSDLIHSGIAPGKAVGEALRRLLDEVLENPAGNTKEHLLTLL